MNKQNNQLRILIFGPQLSGKGTQAANIAKEYGLAHITTGGILREMYASGDERMREKLEPVVIGGKLLGDDDVNGIITKYLDAIKGGFILDGYPRTLGQAEFLETYLHEHDSGIDTAVLIDISAAEIARRRDYRIKTEGRKDDADDAALQKRLDQYHAKTVPVVKHYEKQGILIKINGEQTREQVFADIKKSLAFLVPRKT